MNFWIQACNPRITGEHSDDDETLWEALETVFPLYTESAILVWKHIYIPLGYKYDLSIMIDDILNMLESLLQTHEGNLFVNWPSNTFSVTWTLKWSKEILDIYACWNTVIGKTEKLLSEQKVINIEKNVFIFEWKSILINMFAALNNSGYTQKQIPDMIKLENIISRIESVGILYS